MAGVAIIVYCLYQGGALWKGLFLVMAVLSLYEYGSMLKHKQIEVMWVPDYLFMLMLWASPLLNLDWLWAGLMALMLVMAAVAVISYPRLTVAEVSMNLFGPLYIGLTLQYSLRMLYLPDPFLIMLLALLLTWASDVGGYAVGLKWGRTKLAPQLSPKKTWEGVAGSFLFSVMTALVFAYFTTLSPIKAAYLVILALFASLAAQLGDLFMSSIKRYFGVKDSGFIIPGHGGVLDRFDSFLLVLPLIYYGFHLLT